MKVTEVEEIREMVKEKRVFTLEKKSRPPYITVKVNYLN